MFEKFTDRAWWVVALAQEEAWMLNHSYIGTEHILLGLIHEGEGGTARALESLGISLEAVRQQVEEIIGQTQQAPSGHIQFTPRAKKVLELSLREALQLGHDYIGAEHILLGLIREGDGVAAQVLVKLGADLNRVRQQVIRLADGYQAKPTISKKPASSEEPESSEDPEGPEYVTAVEKDLLSVIIHDLDRARMTVEEAQQMAADFLALLPASDPSDMENKLVNFSKAHPLAEAIWRRHVERWPLLPEISTIRVEKQTAVNFLAFDRAARLRGREKELLKKMQELPSLFSKP